MAALFVLQASWPPKLKVAACIAPCGCGLEFSPFGAGAPLLADCMSMMRRLWLYVLLRRRVRLWCACAAVS
jgi:hypothetical protein